MICSVKIACTRVFDLLNMRTSIRADHGAAGIWVVLSYRMSDSWSLFAGAWVTVQVTTLGGARRPDGEFIRASN
jgi:hypothetical protein